MKETGPSDLELLCIGNALVDVFALGEGDMDRGFGLLEPVQHISMDTMRNILAVLPDFTACSGGGSANVAKIAGRLGIKSAFIGAAGAAPVPAGKTATAGTERPFDQFGRLFKQQLEEAGVLTALIQKREPTGACLVLTMPDGRTVIAASPSAALELTPGDIDENLIRRAQVLVLDGFMLGRKDLVRHILELADKYGTPVALDTSAAGLAAERAVDIVTYARAYPLILFMNEDEAKAFYRALSPNFDERKNEAPGLSDELVELFQNFTANDIFPIITVKLGVRGAVVFAGGQVFREETIPVIPLETTGAGDAFCAAFLAAWIREKKLSECAAFGNRAARVVLDVKGTHVDPKALAKLGKQLR